MDDLINPISELLTSDTMSQEIFAMNYNIGDFAQGKIKGI